MLIQSEYVPSVGLSAFCVLFCGNEQMRDGELKLYASLLDAFFDQVLFLTPLSMVRSSALPCPVYNSLTITTFPSRQNSDTQQTLN